MKIKNITKHLRIAFCYWFLSIIFFLLGVFTLCNWIAYWRTGNWTLVEGKITQLEITSYKESQDNIPWQGHGELKCVYEYDFGGQSHTSHQIGAEIFDDASYRSSRYKLLKELQDSGDTVDVLVNPKAPERSTLFREINSDMYFYPPLVIFWFVMIFLGVKKNQKKKF